MSTKHLKRIAVVCVLFCLAILFSIYIARNTPPEQTTINTTPQRSPCESGTPQTAPRHVRFRSSIPRREDADLKHFQQTEFYRTIVDNNLFRPLGWTPPRPTEPYRLIGTILPRSTNTPPQAIIETTAGKKTYIVTTGEKIEASTEVVSIEGKQVVLSTDGKQRTLRLPIRF